jgi:hypothetical protein
MTAAMTTNNKCWQCGQPAQFWTRKVKNGKLFSVVCVNESLCEDCADKLEEKGYLLEKNS